VGAGRTACAEGCRLGSAYLAVALSHASLPPCCPRASPCRHQKLQCVFRPGAPYNELLSEFDRVQLARLSKFQQLCTYRRTPRQDPLLVPVHATPGAAGEAPMQVAPALKAYYSGLMAKYIPQGALRW
jgi:hypothetical protein